MTRGEWFVGFETGFGLQDRLVEYFRHEDRALSRRLQRFAHGFPEGLPMASGGWQTWRMK